MPFDDRIHTCMAIGRSSVRHQCAQTLERHRRARDWIQALCGVQKRISMAGENERIRGYSTPTCKLASSVLIRACTEQYRTGAKYASHHRTAPHSLKVGDLIIGAQFTENITYSGDHAAVNRTYDSVAEVPPCPDFDLRTAQKHGFSVASPQTQITYPFHSLPLHAPEATCRKRRYQALAMHKTRPHPNFFSVVLNQHFAVAQCRWLQCLNGQLLWSTG